MTDSAQTPTAKPHRSPVRRLIRWLFRALGIFLVASVVLAAIYVAVPPPVTPLMVIRLVEGEGLSKDWTAYDNISPNLVRAVIASEDAKFCSHHGFDWDAIGKAWSRNQTAKRIKGGSTISQQTAKNVFLWPDRTYLRKGLEFYFTGLIELLWSKKRVIEVYLNVVEFGHGVYGAEAAAQAHFGKSAAALSKREAALLAAVLPNPLRWSASKPTAYIRSRASTIQARMNDVPDPTGDPCARAIPAE
jgi:monofunctional biosynthetic peptidoglycan transglycosylase